MKSLRLPPFLTGAWLVLSLGWAPCLVAQAPAEDAPQEIEGALHSVTVAHQRLISPAECRMVAEEYRLH